MSRMIFVNLPVADLPRSKRFFESLGFAFNSRFTDETAACMVIDDNINAMLLTHEKFETFTPKSICDAKKSSEVLISLSCESRREVDEYVRRAVDAGGAGFRDPRDHGFMYEHGFQDPDGHIWEVLYMEPGAED